MSSSTAAPRKLLIYVVLAILVLLAIAQFGPSLVFGGGIYEGEQIPPPALRDAKA
jgi:hypothetical protein